MATIQRKNLFGKLNGYCYKAVENSTIFCKMRGNPYVELVHWIQQLVQGDQADCEFIFQHFGIDRARLSSDIVSRLDDLPRGATAISDFSPHLEELIKQAWMFTTLKFGDSAIRSGFLIYAALETTDLKRHLLNISTEFAKIKSQELEADFYSITKKSTEGKESSQDGTTLDVDSEGRAQGSGPAEMGRQEALAKFTVDLTEQAENGELDLILGRDMEIRQIMDILGRKRQNNPILTGEAGVGKTAVVEGLAQRVARGDVPPLMQGVRIMTLDLGLLQAGASVKGEFENRLRQVIEEVQSSEKPIILFIDEAHTLIGSGGTEGQNDAANLLKPALARGKLRTIAATTWAEYKKYLEKDPALARRFQVVKVGEPSEANATIMLRGQIHRLEQYHRVNILDEAIVSAVELSHKYIPSRQLPDKAISLLDTACSRVAITQHATPAVIEDQIRMQENLEAELRVIEREEKIGTDHKSRKEELNVRLEEVKAARKVMEDRYDREKELVDKILEVKARIQGENTDDAESETTDPEVDETATEAVVKATAVTTEESNETETDDEADRAEAIESFRSLKIELADVQGESPLVHSEVNADTVASVIADWTGIPVGRMVKNEVKAVLNLVDTMEQRILGQRHALETIAKRIQTSRARLDNPKKPIGVFLLAGTSGVGKTETALALAECLYGGEHTLITINMSEFQEAHTVSTLKGAPPGYVGYGEGGVLTEAVRRRPYSVVLLDEVEKAHPDVHEIFFQVFDKGEMEDGEGRLIDFRNTIILLTTNAGTDLISTMCSDPELIPDVEAMGKALREPLMEVFPPALLGRMVTVPYYPLSEDVLKNIIRLQLNRIVKRIKNNHGIKLTCEESVIEQILARCTEVESGGRMIDSILTNTLLPAISHYILNAMVSGQEITEIVIAVKESEFTYEVNYK